MTLEATCERPNCPENGEVISKNENQKVFNPGEKVWFKCIGCFQLAGNKDFVCQKDGNWKPQPFPKCVRQGNVILCKSGRSFWLSFQLRVDSSRVWA